MTNFIVDTNIIINDPNILNYWSPLYKIIIPDFIINEVSRIYLPYSFKHNIKDIITNSINAGFIEMQQIDDTLNKEIFEVLGKYHASENDAKLVVLANKYLKNKQKVFLVSDDGRLINLAEKYKIPIISLIEFHRIIDDFKKISLSSLKQNETIKKYSLRKWAIELLIAILSGFLINTIWTNFEYIYISVSIFLIIITLILLSYIFYLMRTHFRTTYGFIELFFGFILSFSIFNEKGYVLAELTSFDIIKLVAGIYVMVRGIDNFEKGVQGTYLEPFIAKIFFRRKRLAIND